MAVPKDLPAVKSRPPEPYPHVLPRLLSKRLGEPQKHVKTPEECEQAFAEGWTLLPQTQPGPKEL